MVAKEAETKSRRFERRVLAGKYQLGRLIGRGGMGAVWIAEHLDLHSPVAVKLLEDARALDETARRRFITEARAAANLRSPNIVQVFDFGVDDDTPFMVMELLEGETLKDRLKRGPLSLEATRRVIDDVARGLTRAHQTGVVHRDLKPDNIFLARDEDREHGKILDFGIARVADGLPTARRPENTETGQMVGTPYYMSPEQAMNSKDVDHRTDVWALGVITYECLTGRKPFDSDNVMSLAVRICTGPMPVPSQVAAVPAGFDAWFERAVNRNPDARFQSAKDAAEALRTVDTSSASAGAAAALPTAERTDGVRAQLVVAAGAFAVLAAVGIGAGAVVALRDQGPDAGVEVASTPVITASSIRSSASSSPSPNALPAPPPAPEPTSPAEQSPAQPPPEGTARSPKAEAPGDPRRIQPKSRRRDRESDPPASGAPVTEEFPLRDPWLRDEATAPAPEYPEPPAYSRKELDTAFSSDKFDVCKAVGASRGQKFWVEGKIEKSTGKVASVSTDVKSPAANCVANRVKEIRFRVVGDGFETYNRFVEIP